MKKVLLVTLLLTSNFYYAQDLSYKAGEYLQYRVHYGILNAGFASLTVKENNLDGKPHYHITGEGSSSGAVRTFYKVDDRYETYIDKATGKPSKFIRKIDEGGHTRDQEFSFDHNKKVAAIKDNKREKTTYKSFTSEIQDIISAFYYMRNTDTSNLKTGDFMSVDIMMDDGIYKFKLKILGRETVKTKFGKIKCLKIRPYVQSGRIFKESESVTMWVTDDKNHVPIQIKASLMVGSLKADLHGYKNVKYPLNFQK